MREHQFKHYSRWKAQRKTLRVEVRRETGKAKDPLKIRDLFADERCRPGDKY